MSLKKLSLTTALDMARIANGLDIYPHPHQPRIDHRTFGTNPKRCKSCASYPWCNKHNGIRPMDNACSSYERVKGKGN